MTAPAVQITGLQVGYGGRPVAAIPDRAFTPDRVWLITGANGSGKTTLLKTLAGLLPPIAGSMAPVPVTGRHGCVFVHSTPFLFRGSVRSNLLLALASREELGGLVDRFDLTDRLDQPVNELSHGLRQRTAIARAIACQPRLLLLDEPEGGLDDRALGAWRSFIATAVERRETTIVVAAHRPGGLEGVPLEEIRL